MTGNPSAGSVRQESPERRERRAQSCPSLSERGDIHRLAFLAALLKVGVRALPHAGVLLEIGLAVRNGLRVDLGVTLRGKRTGVHSRGHGLSLSDIVAAKTAATCDTQNTTIVRRAAEASTKHVARGVSPASLLTVGTRAP